MHSDRYSIQYWVGLRTWDIRSGRCQLSDPLSLAAGLVRVPSSIIASIMFSRKEEGREEEGLNR